MRRPESGDDEARCSTITDRAEAIFLLLGNRLGKTTGRVLSVDDGLREAFLR